MQTSTNSWRWWFSERIPRKSRFNAALANKTHLWVSECKVHDKESAIYFLALHSTQRWRMNEWTLLYYTTCSRMDAPSSWGEKIQETFCFQRSKVIHIRLLSILCRLFHFILIYTSGKKESPFTTIYKVHEWSHSIRHIAFRNVSHLQTDVTFHILTNFSGNVITYNFFAAFNC